MDRIKRALGFTVSAGLLMAALDMLNIEMNWKQGLGSAALALIPLTIIVGYETWQEVKQAEQRSKDRRK